MFAKESHGKGRLWGPADSSGLFWSLVLALKMRIPGPGSRCEWPKSFPCLMMELGCEQESPVPCGWACGWSCPCSPARGSSTGSSAGNKQSEAQGRRGRGLPRSAELQVGVWPQCRVEGKPRGRAEEGRWASSLLRPPLQGQCSMLSRSPRPQPFPALARSPLSPPTEVLPGLSHTAKGNPRRPQVSSSHSPPVPPSLSGVEGRLSDLECSCLC